MVFEGIIVSAHLVDRSRRFARGHMVLALGRPGQTVQATLGIVSALGQSWRPAELRQCPEGVRQCPEGVR